MVELIFHVTILVIGLFVMIYAAGKSVDHSIKAPTKNQKTFFRFSQL